MEDDIGSDEEAKRQSLPVALDFIRKTGIDVFAPAIGNAHGVYRAEPRLDAQRVSDIVAAEPIPIALHGGTGMTDAQFSDLIERGCAKVNISTALKIAYMKSNLAFLRGVALHGLDQIGNEIGAALVLVEHIRPLRLGGLLEARDVVDAAARQQQAQTRHQDGDARVAQCAR